MREKEAPPNLPAFIYFYIDFIELFKTAKAGQKGTVNRSLSAFIH